MIGSFRLYGIRMYGKREQRVATNARSVPKQPLKNIFIRYVKRDLIFPYEIFRFGSR